MGKYYKLDVPLQVLYLSTSYIHSLYVYIYLYMSWSTQLRNILYITHNNTSQCSLFSDYICIKYGKHLVSSERGKCGEVKSTIYCSEM